MAEQLANLEKGVNIKFGENERITTYTGSPSFTTSTSNVSFVMPYTGMFAVKAEAGSPDGWINGPFTSMQSTSSFYVEAFGYGNKGDTITVTTYNLKNNNTFRIIVKKLYAD